MAAELLMCFGSEPRHKAAPEPLGANPGGWVTHCSPVRCWEQSPEREWQIAPKGTVDIFEDVAAFWIRRENQYLRGFAC
jgi:hypothetical protein